MTDLIDCGVTAEIEPLVGIVGVVPFMPGGEIVGVAVERGIDFPSGHVEPFDAGPAEAVRREAAEEAGIMLGPLIPVAHLRIVDAAEPGLEQYVALYTAMVTRLGRFRPSVEVRERLVLPPEEFLARYRAEEVALCRAMVAEAQRKLGLSPAVEGAAAWST